MIFLSEAPLGFRRPSLFFFSFAADPNLVIWGPFRCVLLLYSKQKTFLHLKVTPRLMLVVAWALSVWLNEVVVLYPKHFASPPVSKILFFSSKAIHFLKYASLCHIKNQMLIAFPPFLVSALFACLPTALCWARAWGGSPSLWPSGRSLWEEGTGKNVPFSVGNKWPMLVMMTLSFGSGFAALFFVVRHWLLKR